MCPTMLLYVYSTPSIRDIDEPLTLTMAQAQGILIGVVTAFVVIVTIIGPE